MCDSFLKYWFNGFEASLKRMDDKNREVIFEECGKSCSTSYSRQIYIDEFKTSSSISEFLEHLKLRFPEIKFEIIKEEEILELTYCYCGCDLVRSGFIKTPLLCECSRRSLLYNWESVLGENKVEIKLLQSILDGSPSCKFQIHIIR